MSRRPPQPPDDNDVVMIVGAEAGWVDAGFRLQLELAEIGKHAARPKIFSDERHQIIQDVARRHMATTGEPFDTREKVEEIGRRFFEEWTQAPAPRPQPAASERDRWAALAKMTHDLRQALFDFPEILYLTPPVRPDSRKEPLRRSTSRALRELFRLATTMEREHRHDVVNPPPNELTPRDRLIARLCIWLLNGNWEGRTYDDAEGESRGPLIDLVSVVWDGLHEAASRAGMHLPPWSSNAIKEMIPASRERFIRHSPVTARAELAGLPPPQPRGPRRKKGSPN